MVKIKLKKDIITLQERKWTKRTKYGTRKESLALMSINRGAMILFTRRTWYGTNINAAFVLRSEQLDELYSMIKAHYKKTAKIQED